MGEIGFLGLGVIGLPMAINLLRKSGCPVLAYDVRDSRMDLFVKSGGVAVEDPEEIYQNCSVIMQMLPTQETIMQSLDEALRLCRRDTVIVELSSAAPEVILAYAPEMRRAGLFLLDSPVSGEKSMAVEGTLAIMTGGNRSAFTRVEPYLSCMGVPIYTGGSGTGSITKLVNNIISAAYLAAITEGLAFAAKAGLDLETTFQATRGGLAGGVLYDNKVPKIIRRDYEPEIRIAVQRRDLDDSRHFADRLGVDIPMASTALRILNWMQESGYDNIDQVGMVKYYEKKMDVKVGNRED
jgi:2-hydroxy-3-oxopropionate reductase